MGFDAGSAFSEAWERVTTQVAAVVIGLYAVATIVQTAALQDVVREVVEEVREIARDELEPQEYQDFVEETDTILEGLHLALGLELLPAIALLLVATFAGTAVVALAIDAFARGATSVDDLDTSRLLWHTLNIFVGGIAFFVLLMVGFGLFFLPGLIVLVLFAFFPVAVVVEDTNFVSAFGSSIGTVTDNVGPTLLLLLLAFVVGVAGTVLSTVVTVAMSGTIAGIVSTTISAAATILILAMLTRAYVAAHSDATNADATEPDAGADVADPEGF